MYKINKKQRNGVAKIIELFIKDLIFGNQSIQKYYNQY